MTQNSRWQTGGVRPAKRIFVSRFLLVSILLLLAACGPIPQVDERMKYWTGEAESFFDDRRTMQEVHSWLRSNSIIYTFNDSDIVDGNWTMTLEKIYIEDWRCDWVDIRIEISVDDMLTVQGHKLSQKRACLW